MPGVQVRIVRMRVHEPLVRVRMRMRLVAVPREAVPVTVVPLSVLFGVKVVPVVP